MKVRKKPVDVQAFEVGELLRAFSEEWGALPAEVVQAYEGGKILVLKDSLEVVTLEGRMEATRDHMLMQGVSGELYPCRKDIFEATYEVLP